jgi:hypothetical protein
LRNQIGIEYRQGATQATHDITMPLSVAISNGSGNGSGTSFSTGPADQASVLDLQFRNIAPTISSAYYGGDIINLQFAAADNPTNISDQTSQWNAWLGSAPTSAFVVKVNGTAVPVSKVVSKEQAFLQLASPIPANATVTIAYTDVAGDQVKNVLQTWDGIDVQTAASVSAKPFSGFTHQALDGAVLGVDDFSSGTYVQDGIDTTEGGVSKVTAVGTDTYTVTISPTKFYPNPSYDPSAVAGTFKSFQYTNAQFTLELQKTTGTLSYLPKGIAVNSVFDTNDAFKVSKNVQLKSLINYGATEAGINIPTWISNLLAKAFLGGHYNLFFVLSDSTSISSSIQTAMITAAQAYDSDFSMDNLAAFDWTSC